MFSLIITIISIALVAALAVATIYYGGDSFSEGRDAADAAAIVNQAQQIGGAATMMSVQEPNDYDNNLVADLDPDTLTGDETSLVGAGYLSGEPEPPHGDGWTLDLDNKLVELSGTIGRAEVCNAISEEAGADLIEETDTDDNPTGEMITNVAIANGEIFVDDNTDGVHDDGESRLPYGCSWDGSAGSFAYRY